MIRLHAALLALLAVALPVACGGRSEESQTGGGATGGMAGGGTGGSAGAGAGGTAGSGGSAGGGGVATGGAGASTGGTGTGGGAGTGGTAGAGGGSAGTGGAAGAPSCVSGGVCATEGASCTESGCCPCSYTCAQGTWSIAACPGCIAPGCPPTAPADGAPCNACIDETGAACGYTLPDGTPVSATCDGTLWHVATGLRPCADATACLAGEVCLFSGGLTPPPGGVCVPDPCRFSPLSCGCAATLCTGGPCISAEGGIVRCECFVC